MIFKVVSFQVADNIDIRQLTNAYTASLHYADLEELFYCVNEHQYLYVFKYGIVCFLGFDETGISSFLQLIKPFCKNYLEQRLSDEFDIETGATSIMYGFNKITIPTENIEAIRLIMLNVSQSVALDYFDQQTNLLLEENNYHTQILEKKGSIELVQNIRENWESETTPKYHAIV